MNKLILALLLLLPMTAHAQVSGPGNTFGGGGGGIGTCTDPLPASGICEDATGNLVLNDAGAGIIATPATDTGSNIVLSEGSDLGPDSFTLGLGGTSLSGSVTCTIEADGAINSFCPIFNNLTGIGRQPVLSVNAGLNVPGAAVALITASELLVTDFDAGDTLTYTAAVPSNGTLNLGTSFTQTQIGAGSLGYTQSALNALTSDSFLFTVSDGNGGSIGSTAFNLTIPVPNFPFRTSLKNIATAVDVGGDWNVNISPYRQLPNVGNAAGYIAFGEVLTTGAAEVIYDPPVLLSCITLGQTPPTAGCSGPIGISQRGGVSTDWTLTAVATITGGTVANTISGLCKLTLYRNNSVDEGTVGNFANGETVGATDTLSVTVTTTAVGGGSNYDYFGLFRDSASCVGVTAVDVTFTAEVVP